jgi:predicted choloylglycine hydrolase
VDKGSRQILETCTSSEEPISINAHAPSNISKVVFAVDKGSGQILETCTSSDEPIILTADATAIYVDFLGKGNLTAEGFQVIIL